MFSKVSILDCNIVALVEAFSTIVTVISLSLLILEYDIAMNCILIFTSCTLSLVLHMSYCQSKQTSLDVLFLDVAPYGHGRRYDILGYVYGYILWMLLTMRDERPTMMRIRQRQVRRQVQFG